VFDASERAHEHAGALPVLAHVVRALCLLPALMLQGAASAPALAQPSAQQPAQQSAQQTWPSKPVTLVVTVAAGGSIDAVARMVADEMTRNFGQTVLIDNRGGAAGSIAASIVSRATPDGHTILVSGTNTLTLNPILQKKDDNWFDPIKGFVPIGTSSRTNYILVVGPHIKATTAEEFIAFARKQEGKLVYGSSGSGSLIHVATEMFNNATDIRATHVPYKGLAPALQDLLAGRIDYMFDSATTVEQVKAGKLRALAVIGPQPLQVLPDLKPLSAHGVKGLEVLAGWYGWFAPAGTPPAVVKQINAEIARIVALPKVRERMLAQGTEPMTMTPEAFAARLADDIRRFEPVLKKMGISVY
jgi:tripartite-type tricarboxylate transporter receptor subunit TctC